MLIHFLKKIGPLVFVKRKIFMIPERLYPVGISIKWFFFSAVGMKGISERSHTPELIVSLTTFPARIRTVHRTIRTLLMQSEKPDQVILWLAEEQFPEKEKELPKELLELKKYGLKICWCEDIRSYKKLIPTLRKYPEAVIVTADDDLYYSRHWLRILYREYRKNPSYVQSHIVTEISLKDGKYQANGRRNVTGCRSSFLYKVVGCGGVLYPPHSLNPEIIREDIFMKICETNDDVWFWMMAVLNGTKVHMPIKNDAKIRYVEHTQEGPTLSSKNDRGEKLFWVQFKNMLEYYPEVDKILKEAYYANV